MTTAHRFAFSPRLLGLLLGFAGPTVFAATVVAPPEITVDWRKVEFVSKTTPSLQVVVNPLLARHSPIHDAAFAALKNMGADDVRFVPWLPYPRLAVAELAPPSAGKTSWDFSLIDPLMTDFMQAVQGHASIINFSTIPAWLFQTKQPVVYPEDPQQVDWTYTQGTELREGGLRELGAYYARLVSWYVDGGFVDELGKRHTSGHRFKIPYWEVFNEVDFEHRMTPRQYVERYDAVVAAIHAVSPDTKFVGLALALPSLDPDMFEYFLNPANHQPGIPLDMISYHFYATPTADQTVDDWQYTFFDQADRFLATARYIDAIRRRLSPATQVAMDEIGSILPGDPGKDTTHDNPAITPEYWNACGALYAYVFVGAAKLGVNIVSTSQLVGFPSQFPSVTMVDWRTGVPNARYWVLKLLVENFHPGDRFVTTAMHGENDEAVLAQGFVTPTGRKILLVNKRNRRVTVALATPVHEGSVALVDGDSGAKITRMEHWSGKSIELKPFAVAILTLGQ